MTDQALPFPSLVALRAEHVKLLTRLDAAENSASSEGNAEATISEALLTEIQNLLARVSRLARRSPYRPIATMLKASSPIGSASSATRAYRQRRCCSPNLTKTPPSVVSPGVRPTKV